MENSQSREILIQRSKLRQEIQKAVIAEEQGNVDHFNQLLSNINTKEGGECLTLVKSSKEAGRKDCRAFTAEKLGLDLENIAPTTLQKVENPRVNNIVMYTIPGEPPHWGVVVEKGEKPEDIWVMSKFGKAGGVYKHKIYAGIPSHVGENYKFFSPNIDTDQY